MRFKNLIAAVLALVAYRTPLYTTATGPTKGENAKVFALLCDLVTTAEDAAAKPVSLKPAEETTNAVALITLLLAAPETLEQLLLKTTRDALLADTSKMPHKLCTVDRVADCTAALQAVDKLGEAGVKRMVASFKQRSEILDAINATTRALTSLLQTNNVDEAATANPTITKLANQAIYGAETKPAAFQLTAAASNRQTTCGQRTPAAGKKAGSSLAADLICICASDSAQGGNTGCYGSNPEKVTFNGPAADRNTAWQNIKTNCGHRKPRKGATAAQLRKLTSDVYQVLHEPKGTDGKVGYLGHVSTGPNAGDCSGEDGNGNGACVHYGITSNASNRPAWMQRIETFADEIDKSATNTRAAVQNLEKIETLNRALTNLIALNNAHQQLASTVTSTKETQSTDNKPSVVAATCNLAKDNQVTCEKLKTQGCVFNEQDKKCELKSEVKEKLEKTNQEGKDGKKEEQCKGKEQKDCKSPNFKGEGETCKDFGILVNKKFVRILLLW
uniref:Variant surface glycoprotein n=1 Tax=Trypanosoma brucei TaxID=5691 RepID=A0A1J0R635_9TRYP|nr:variant surface glycoprotein 1125.1031 [Trypanosoma brucei]ARB50640.1 variant surface glycoprotein [Trypanosoma brucei]